MAVFFSTPDGGPEDDFVVGHPNQEGGAENTLSGNGGDDVLYGDYDFFFVDAGTFSPRDLSPFPGAWSTSENQDIAFSTTIPHVSIIREVPAATADLFSVTTASPGQRLILDIDYGDHRNGTPVDVVIDVFRPDGTVLARLGDQPLDRGSIVAEAGGDLILPEAGTYRIQVREVGGAVLPVGATYVLNVSLTGQEFNNAIG
ncbi:MAG: hypothetical protein AAF526_08445, partial [Pseudomonadota bacterium]